MQCWIKDPATDGIDDKIKMAYVLLKTNIPAFHYSIFGANSKAQKTFILSAGCRNFEAFNETVREISQEVP
jgi:hypothetical protein